MSQNSHDVHFIAEGQDVWMLCHQCHRRLQDGVNLGTNPTLQDIQSAAASHTQPVHAH